jgi:hypothetical protein
LGLKNQEVGIQPRKIEETMIPAIAVIIAVYVIFRCIETIVNVVNDETYSYWSVTIISLAAMVTIVIVSIALNSVYTASGEISKSLQELSP